MSHARLPLLALASTAALALAALAAGGAFAGSTTGFGDARTVHLADPANGLTLTGLAPESFNAFTGYTYNFTVNSTAATLPLDYLLTVVVSPLSDTETRFNGTAHVGAGPASTSATVVVPPNALPFTNANTPFAIELRSADGATLIDSAEFSIDIHSHEPPADGGLLALALASASVWGIVFLYALNLHLTQRKLRARVLALEAAQHTAAAEAPADGSQR